MYRVKKIGKFESALVGNSKDEWTTRKRVASGGAVAEVFTSSPLCIMNAFSAGAKLTASSFVIDSTRLPPA